MRNNVYYILQTPPNSDNNYMPLDMRQSLDRHDYCYIWYDNIPSSVSFENESSVYNFLEELFEEFNLRHPDHFAGHSLSVGDLIQLNLNGTSKTYFCDSIGFVDVTERLAK